MASKETRKRVREAVAADQARYDEVTRRLQERIARGLTRLSAGQKERRAAS